MTNATSMQVLATRDTGLRSALLAAHLPVADLDEPGRLFFVFKQEGQLIGYGGLELAAEHGLLRSIVVMPDLRGTGHGKTITRLLIQEAARQGISALYLLTDAASGFFENNGFRRIARETAPDAILATRQASSICPSSAILMVRDLSL